MRMRLSGGCSLLTIAMAFCSLIAADALHAEARWISHPAAAVADADRASITLQFRREIVLPEQPKDFVVNVSADNRFVLYVNGQRVGAGPARGNLRHWRYETLDLASYLVPGKNVLAAHVWNDGRAAPLAQISSGRTGFWLRAQDANRASLVESSEAWSVRVDGARTVSPGMPHMLAALGDGFYAAGAPETIDGSQLVADWASKTSVASDWQPAVIAEGEGAPARSLVADTLPQMRFHRVPSGRVVRSSGVVAQGFPGRSIVVPPNSQATLLVDAGRVLAAYPALKVSGGAGTEVRVTYVEALYEREVKERVGNERTARVRQSNRAAVGEGLALGLTDTFKLDGSQKTFQPLWWRTWRFAEINVKTGTEPLTLEDFETWETGYPFERRGHFTSDDAELDAIWNVGWMTALLDAHETYMDTAYWEQLQYIGDTRIQMLLTYAVSGDTRLAVQALDTFDQSRSVEGLPQSAWPGVLKQVIPPFALLWVGTLHDYWMRHPDTAVITRTLPGTRAVFDEFEKYIQPSGLVGPMPGWPFVDWKPGLDGWADRDKGILSCVISMQYVGALREGADLERHLGDAVRAKEYTARAARASRGVNSECWDEKRGLYADTPSKSTFSQHATVLAILHDIAPAAQHRALIEKVLVPGRGIDPPEGMTGTSYYFSFYLAQALDHAGLADRYLDLLQPWRQMLRRNFTTWPETPDPSRSDTHAWSSHPTHGLMEYVAGIRPDAPAFARVRIAPHLGSLTKLDVAAVHPKGLIQTQYSVRGDELTAVIDLPQGVPGSFVWKGRVQPLKAGRNELTVRAQYADSLEVGFRNPPSVAKPRVWWHWMDGNVSRDGIQKDLAWLNTVGIGGVHNFDAALGGPGREATSLVDERVAYLTPRWRDTFRYAVGQAQQLGMEFTIAASPGWSESGGPWVKPAEGMKKLVWSETLIRGGNASKPRAPSPPRITGPFQNVAFGGGIFGASEAPPEHYADVGVIAFPARPTDVAAGKPIVTTSSGKIETERLSDGDLAKVISLPYGTGATDWIQFAYPKPQQLQALTVAVARPEGGTPSDMETGGAIWFEASEDGRTFRKVIDVPRTGTIQQTIAFAPVTARTFRLVLQRPTPQPSVLDILIGRPSPPPPTEHHILECVPHATARVHRFEDKAGFSTRAIAAADDTASVAGVEAVAVNSVIDLSNKLRQDGTLDWVPPKGDWVVLRFGYSLTGRMNHPASKEGTGLEVDKLNREHVRSYFDAYFGEYAKTLDAPSIGQQGLQYMLTDSYEAGAANWTDDMFEQFRRRRGYDAKPWLPVLVGRIVDSAAASDKFLWDFRQTLGDLIADAHYGQLSESLHAKGMKRYGESHEGGRAFIGDGMQVKKSADVPMGALWASAPWASRDSYDMDIRESASVAHIYGQNLVAAESLTAFGTTYAFTPETLKPFADRELAMGLNRFVIHTSVHQPDDRPGPGATLGPFGQWFTRHETWAEFAAPWVSYLARSSYLLQQGRFVADIAYLYGQDDNITNLFATNKPVIPQGFNFDFVNADALVNVFSVKDGMLVTPSGMQYRVLALDPSTQRMSLPVLRKIAALVEEGATVVGARPTVTPSLADDAAEFDRLAERLWGEGANERSVGRGKVLGSQPLAVTMQRLAITPDCLFSGDDVDPELRYVHRKLDHGDIYFITNGTDRAKVVEASFRVSGFAPEIWRADSGEITPASYRMETDSTVVPLKLEPNAALFVVFRQPTTAASRTTPETVTTRLGEVEGPWNVSFQENRGAPAQARFDTLSSWTTNSEPGIRYFSGTATYAASFRVSREWLAKNARIRLDLGDVKNIAGVSINGKVVGVAWKAPFILDVTDAVKAGSNRLEIKVANLWPNRMIGDKQPGARQVAYATFDPFKADSPLLPSGLLGPVVISRSVQP